MFCNGQTSNYCIKIFQKIWIRPNVFNKNFYTACVIRAKPKTINFNIIKAKYKINDIYLIKLKYKLLVVANLGFHLYAQLLFLIPQFSIFWDTVIYVIKAKYKITKICLIKGKYKILFVANLKLHLYAQFILFLRTYFSFFWDTVICVIKTKYEINQIYVIKA